ncbi:Cyclic di-GMP phosphodiesterase response regulator RpfG [Pseudobythopirellula maris]|uniref:Cyclic di-GMP phosphodiesterase response regulator RpfG n=1 Tax=Pseudobythopirellula maris TaxID=2527991 RepID=A0A5C5ZHG9_9BACT|nr:HD domain-containing phosphohydrolase [Pseudobythopirellula maris]TWT86497.1 Cyclic di-GMP phosphodiesterase response regulator RpfG [Pseudobythopirellula maris]
MNTTPQRLLVVDDNPAIHDDIRKTLCRSAASESASDSELGAAELALFGEEPAAPAPRAAEAAPQEGLQIDSAYQGAEGLELVRAARIEGRPFPMAFVDVRMPPGWDGIETAERIFEEDEDIQVVLCTAYSDYSIGDIVKRFGPTDRLLILKKPFDIAEVTLLSRTLSEKWRLGREARRTIATQGDKIFDLERLLTMVEQSQISLRVQHENLEDRSRTLSDELRERTAEVMETRQAAIYTLAQITESRDPETGEHLLRMREVAQLIASRLAESGPYKSQVDEEFLGEFYCSTPLHDIGKVGVPDSVLLKPGKLTTEEFQVMKRHTLIGAQALEGAIEATPHGKFLAMAADIARAHHEWFDGSGYPLGLAGEAIPLAARIAAVADVFDAVTSKRVYKDAMSVEAGRQTIIEGSGKQFDPVVVEAFLEVFDGVCAVRDRSDETALATPV